MNDFGSTAFLNNSPPQKRRRSNAGAAPSYPAAWSPTPFATPLPGYPPAPMTSYGYNQGPGNAYGGYSGLFQGYPAAPFYPGNQAAYPAAAGMSPTFGVGLSRPASIAPPATGATPPSSPQRGSKRKRRRQRRRALKKTPSAKQLLIQERERPSRPAQAVPSIVRDHSLVFAAPRLPRPWMSKERSQSDDHEEIRGRLDSRSAYSLIALLAFVLLILAVGIAIRLLRATSEEFSPADSSGGVGVADLKQAPNYTPAQNSPATHRHQPSLPTSPPPAPEPSGQGGCPPASCRWQARYLRHKLNPLVAPCEDFYSHVCSAEWFTRGVESQPYTYAASTSVMLGLWEHLRQQPTNRTTFMSAASMVLQSCVSGSRRDTDWNVLRQIMADLLLNGWPYDEHTHVTDVDVIAARAEKMLGLSTLVRTFVRERAPSNAILLHVDAPPILLRRYKDLFPGRGVKAYSEFVLNVFSLWIPARRAAQFGISNIVDLEEKLSVASSHAMRSVAQLHVTERISGIESHPHWNWVSYFRHFLDKNAYRRSRDKLVLLDPVYFDRLSSILPQVSSNALLNYIGYKLFVHLSPVLPPNKAAFMVPLSHQYHLTGGLPDRLEACMYLLERLYPLGTRSLVWSHVLSKAPDMLSGDRANDLHRLENFARSEMKKAASKAPWMSEKEAKIAILKTERMEVKSSLIETYYTLLLSIRDMYWKMEDLSRFHQPTTDTESAFRPGFVFEPDRNEVSVSPATVAFLLGMSNRFDVSSALFYLGELLRGMFAAIGESGSHVDADGEFRNWWTSTTELRFIERAKCLQDRFHDLLGQYYERGDLSADKHLFMDVNVEDGAVLQPLYNIYLRLIDRADSTASVPGQLKSLTVGQLFFVNWASMFCEPRKSDEQVRERLRFKAAVPARLRVNVALSRFAPFATAFNCSSRSEMNPAKQCSFWIQQLLSGGPGAGVSATLPPLALPTGSAAAAAAGLAVPCTAPASAPVPATGALLLRPPLYMPPAPPHLAAVGEAPSSLFASARLLAGLDFGCPAGSSDGASAFRRVLPAHRDSVPPELADATQDQHHRPSTTGGGEGEDVLHEVAAQVLLVALRRARANELFRTLPAADQAAILDEAWPQLFLLQAAHWPLDVILLLGHMAASSSAMGAELQTSARQIQQAIAQCKALAFDPVERTLLETILLCRKGQ
ncbi:hypothetical protein V5799_010124 [Amblyomma americanum]|uniref:NR LBD domain-containing protein n=1 Tax=Amblyomma americanum TaxID=6943 RepID=A0AAQ4F9I2_AMBAM